MDFRFILKRVNEVTNYNLMQYYDVMSRQAMRTVKKIYYLKTVNMALCQQPWPEEIDVFTGPHLRMKQLVYEALEKLSATNFKDDVSLIGLLGCINSTFQELKHHEEIENTCIMKVLQHRLISKQIQAIVRDVHKDNHVLEILSLARKGLKSASKSRTNLNRRTFEDRLKGALESFQREFLPHMRHEEEVFQPLLMEYFTFEELKEIKTRVHQLHSAFTEHSCSHETGSPPLTSQINKNSAFDAETYQNPDNEGNKSSSVDTNSSATEHSSKERMYLKSGMSTADNFKTSENNLTKRTLKAEVDVVTEKEQPLLLSFPPEITLKIFSYLGPKDLCHCAQVCQKWSHSARDGDLWRELYPVRWIFKKDWRFGADSDDMCSCNCDSEIPSLGFDGSSFTDTDLDKEESSDTESSDTESSYDGDSDSETHTEIHQLLGLVRYLIPMIGPTVWVLKLGCCPMLSNGLAFKILSQCPNLRQLDLSQTAVSDLGLKGLFRKGGGLQLEHLDVSGCKNITDKTLFKLSSSLGKLPVGSGISDIEDSSCDCHTICSCGRLISTGITPETAKRELVYLGLSGCYQITDAGLRALAKYGGLPKLRHLDLSGCLHVTAEGLLDLVFVCPALDHTEFFYCDNIDEGPYPETASGCQNLQCKNRVCCRTGE